MTRIKLNLSNLSIPEKIDLAQQIVKAMTGNANFPTPNPSLAQVTTASDNLEKAHGDALAARQESKNKTAIQNQCEEEFDAFVTRLASYVSSIGGDDPVLITSAGMDVQTPATPVGDVGVAKAVEVEAGESDGELRLQWRSVEGARSYVVERSPAAPPNATWIHEAATTKTQITVKGLTSGTRYWFRVAAVGTNGQGGWSDPATKVAP